MDYTTWTPPTQAPIEAEMLPVMSLYEALQDLDFTQACARQTLLVAIDPVPSRASQTGGTKDVERSH